MKAEFMEFTADGKGAKNYLVHYHRCRFSLYLGMCAAWMAMHAPGMNAAEEQIDLKDSPNRNAELIEELPPEIVDRGLHHATVEHRSRLRNPVNGETYERVWRIVQLENGLHYLENGQWRRSEDLVEITADGLAARRGPTQLEFASNLNSPGALRVTTHGGNQFSCQILGLVYSSGGRSVQVAAVRDSVATLYPPNQVVYHSALSGIDGDVRYIYTHGGYQVDFILKGQLPDPELFGMSPDTTWIQLWTGIHRCA